MVAFVDLSSDEVECAHRAKEACALCGFNCCAVCNRFRDEAQRDGSKWHCDECAVKTTKAQFQPVVLAASDLEYTTVMANLMDQMEAGSAKRHMLRDYSSTTPDVLRIKVTGITRIQNPVLDGAFEALVAKWRFVHSNRQGVEPIDDPTARMFHGTTAPAADLIARTGFERVHTTRAAYGIGNYFTDHPQLAIRHHCVVDASTNERTLLVCRVLRGRQARTHREDVVAPAGFDSGGDYEGGKGWVTVLFEDSYSVVVYVVRLQVL